MCRQTCESFAVVPKSVPIERFRGTVSLADENYVRRQDTTSIIGDLEGVASEVDVDVDGGGGGVDGVHEELLEAGREGGDVDGRAQF